LKPVQLIYIRPRKTSAKPFARNLSSRKRTATWTVGEKLHQTRTGVFPQSGDGILAGDSAKWRQSKAAGRGGGRQSHRDDCRASLAVPANVSVHSIALGANNFPTTHIRRHLAAKVWSALLNGLF